jgi:hypothetical protein
MFQAFPQKNFHENNIISAERAAKLTAFSGIASAKDAFSFFRPRTGIRLIRG